PPAPTSGAQRRPVTEARAPPASAPAQPPAFRPRLLVLRIGQPGSLIRRRCPRAMPATAPARPLLRRSKAGPRGKLSARRPAWRFPRAPGRIVVPPPGLASSTGPWHGPPAPPQAAFPRRWPAHRPHAPRGRGHDAAAAREPGPPRPRRRRGGAALRDPGALPVAAVLLPHPLRHRLQDLALDDDHRHAALSAGAGPPGRAGRAVGGDQAARPRQLSVAGRRPALYQRLPLQPEDRRGLDAADAAGRLSAGL